LYAKTVVFRNLYKVTKKIQILLTLTVEFDIINRVFMMAVLWNGVDFVEFRQTQGEKYE